MKSFVVYLGDGNWGGFNIISWVFYKAHLVVRVLYRA